MGEISATEGIENGYTYAAAYDAKQGIHYENDYRKYSTGRTRSHEY